MIAIFALHLATIAAEQVFVEVTDAFNKHAEVENIHKIDWPHTMHMDLDLDWNYTKHGTDWNFADCNDTSKA